MGICYMKERTKERNKRTYWIDVSQLHERQMKLKMILMHCITIKVEINLLKSVQ